MKFSRMFPVALALGSAGAQTLVAFSDPKLPFSFSAPKGWLGVNLGDNTSGVNMISSKTPPASMIRLLFVPKAAGAALDLANELNGFEEGVRSTGVTVRRQSSYPASYGGLRGMERELMLTQKGKNIKMRVWFGQGSKNVYSFQLSDTPERYAKSSALFTQVMRTVRFK